MRHYAHIIIHYNYYNMPTHLRVNILRHVGIRIDGQNFIGKKQWRARALHYINKSVRFCATIHS